MTEMMAVLPKTAKNYENSFDFVGRVKIKSVQFFSKDKDKLILIKPLSNINISNTNIITVLILLK